MSISPLFLVSLFGYLLFSISAIIAFEIRRTSRNVFLKAHEDAGFETKRHVSLGAKLPIAAVTFLIFIALLAIPLFFALPRVGGAGLGSNLAGSGSSITGFSDSVTLGEIGRLKQSSETVMRVRLDTPASDATNRFYWRGVALDSFDNKSWKRSTRGRIERVLKTPNGFFSVNFSGRTANNVIQTFYLEPTGTPVLFSLSKPISVRGHFKVLRADSDNSLRANGIGFERASYSVRSDVSVPSIQKLKTDRAAYSEGLRRYLQLPRGIDQRIARLANSVTRKSRAFSKYDRAKAIEVFFSKQIWLFTRNESFG